jgi:hypothetical protein
VQALPGLLLVVGLAILSADIVVRAIRSGVYWSRVSPDRVYRNVNPKLFWFCVSWFGLLFLASVGAFILGLSSLIVST